MKNKFALFTFFNLLVSSFLLFPANASAGATTWDIQSIDTMKYSRDSSRSPIIKKIIPTHVKLIAQTGANYIAIDTPYDDEFIPVLSQWVNEARKYNLKIWFRGNFSGWEGWFEYPRLTSTAEHMQKTYRFITQNPKLFKDGDIYTPAPEPENGIMGDPRQTGKKAEFNTFLLDSYANCQKAFSQIKTNVNCGIWSMNTDVLRETVYPETIKRTGGIISIDHYTKTPEKLISDVKALHEMFNAKVVLGEFGAPIPDINGAMTQEEQALYVAKVGEYLYQNKSIVKGANYWVIAGGSTTLLNGDNTPRQAYMALTQYFLPGTISGKITNLLGDPIADVWVTDGVNKVKSNRSGSYQISLPTGSRQLQISKEGYGNIGFNRQITPGVKFTQDINMIPSQQDLLYKVRLLLQNIVKK